jgi:hypothetical protein
VSGSRTPDRLLKALDGVDFLREGGATQPKRRTNPHGRTSTRS